MTPRCLRCAAPIENATLEDTLEYALHVPAHLRLAVTCTSCPPATLVVVRRQDMERPA